MCLQFRFKLTLIKEPVLLILHYWITWCEEIISYPSALPISYLAAGGWAVQEGTFLPARMSNSHLPVYYFFLESHPRTSSDDGRPISDREQNFR